MSMPNARAARAKVLADPQGIPSPLYRLETLASSKPWEEVLPHWLSHQRNDFLATESERRLYARSVIASGRSDLAEALGLSESELQWLQMHAHRSSGHWERAGATALRLSPERYPDHLWVLVECLARGECTVAHVRDHVAAAPSDHPANRLLRLLCGSNGVGDLAELEQLVPFAGRSSKTPDDSAPEGLDRALSLLADEVETGPFSAEELSDIEMVSPKLTDELIDRYPDLCQVTPESSAYIRARLDPTLLKDSELEELNHTAELARRAYTIGNVARLDSPGPDAAAIYYRQLLGLQRGQTEEVGALMNHPTLAAVVQSIREGTARPEALADPTTWKTLTPLIRAKHEANYPEAASRWHLVNAVECVYAWKWELAADSARAVLRLAEEEEVRDEALNILAFSLYQTGQDEAAIAALERALEGEYTVNLQANAGVIAEHLAPTVALEHVTRLAAEAPTTELKLAAARRALTIWTMDRPIWAEDDDEEDSNELPPHLVAILRELIALPIPPEDHRWVAKLLASVDSEWLAHRPNTSGVPNADTHEHKVYVARASTDPEAFVAALRAALLERGEDEKWLVEERDAFVTGLTSLVFETEGAIGPAIFAYQAIEQDLPMRSFNKVVLTAAAVVSIVQHVAEQEGEPSDHMLDLLQGARTELSSLADDEKSMAEGLLNTAFDAYARGVANARQKGVQAAVEAASQLEAQLSLVPRYRINSSAVAEATQPIRDFLGNTLSALQRAQEVAVSEDLKEALGEFRSNVQELRNAVDIMSRR